MAADKKINLRKVFKITYSDGEVSSLTISDRKANQILTSLPGRPFHGRVVSVPTLYI